MIHDLADVKSDNIGEQTRIWQFVVVLEGAVVTCDIPDREIWVGNPARFLRSIDDG